MRDQRIAIEPARASTMRREETRVLLVEDSSSKVGRIQGAFAPYNRDDSLSVSTAGDCATARQLLRNQQFDLLILDMVLPMFPGEQARSAAGLDLLKEIRHDESSTNPKYIVGITEHLDNFDALRNEFEASTWLLLRSTSSSDEWVGQLARLLEHILKCKRHQAASYDVDVVVTAALYDPELLGALDLPWRWTTTEHLDEVTMFKRGTISLNDRDISVVASWSARMGLVGSALLCSKLIHNFRPKILCMIGICAGTNPQHNFGDMVASRRVV